MAYEKCRSCVYTCKCCKWYDTRVACSGCENNYDEFEPYKLIKHCPLDGTSLEDNDSVSSELEAFCNKCEKYDVCDKCRKK